MASRRIKGAKQCIWIIRNSEKVSSFCNDVVGDISGIISGATGAVVISRIVMATSVDELLIQLVLTSLIAALTIGGKALGKGFAINYNNQIIFLVGKVLYLFYFVAGKGD
jgi:CBS domain containing-hemolysin-like protein